MTINRCPDPLNFSYLPKKVKRYQKVSACLVVNSLKRTGFNQPYHGEISVQFMQDFPSTKVGLSSAGMTAVQARGGFEWSPVEGGYRNLLSKCGHWRQVTNFCPKCSLQRRFC